MFTVDADVFLEDLKRSPDTWVDFVDDNLYGLVFLKPEAEQSFWSSLNPGFPDNDWKQMTNADELPWVVDRGTRSSDGGSYLDIRDKDFGNWLKDTREKFSYYQTDKPFTKALDNLTQAQETIEKSNPDIGKNKMSVLDKFFVGPKNNPQDWDLDKLFRMEQMYGGMNIGKPDEWADLDPRTIETVNAIAAEIVRRNKIGGEQSPAIVARRNAERKRASREAFLNARRNMLSSTGSTQETIEKSSDIGKSMDSPMQPNLPRGYGRIGAPVNYSSPDNSSMSFRIPGQAAYGRGMVPATERDLLDTALLLDQWRKKYKDGASLSEGQLLGRLAGLEYKAKTGKIELPLQARQSIEGLLAAKGYVPQVEEPPEIGIPDFKDIDSEPSPKFMKDTLDKALAYLRNDATGDFAAKDLLNTRVGTMGGTGLGLMALNAVTGDGLLENIFKTGAGMAAAGGAGMMFPKAGGLGGVALQAAAGLTGNTLAGIVTNLFGGNKKEDQLLGQALLHATQGVPQQRAMAYQIQQPVQYYG